MQKRFKKMFSGIAAILLNEDSTVIPGIAFKKEEEVMLMSLVFTMDFSRID